MKQQSLPGATQAPAAAKPPKTFKAAAAGFDAANLRSALLILEQPERWGGEDAYVVQWARAIVAKAEGRL